MPYIKDKKRKFLVEEMDDDWHTGNIAWIDKVQTAGELQYVMAVMFKSYIERKGLNYQHCNDILGALAGAQMEFYRRTVVPYEKEKISQNGDV